MKTLVKLDTEEAGLVRWIAKAISPTGRVDYVEYRRQAGYRLATVQRILIGERLYKKRWLCDEPTLLGDDTVHLSFEAWQLYSSSEAHALEEIALTAERGGAFGEWG